MKQQIQKMGPGSGIEQMQRKARRILQKKWLGKCKTGVCAPRVQLQSLCGGLCMAGPGQGNHMAFESDKEGVVLKIFFGFGSKGKEFSGGDFCRAVMASGLGRRYNSSCVWF